MPSAVRRLPQEIGHCKASASLATRDVSARSPQAERPPYNVAVDKFTKYQRDLGADLVEEFTALRSSWVSARGTQVSDKGEVSEARGGVRNSRRTLELQVLDNLLTLAKLFKGQPERANEFFDQSLLEDPVRNAAPATTPAPELVPA